MGSPRLPSVGWMGVGAGVGVGAPVGGAVPQACWVGLMLRGEGHAPGCCTVYSIASMVARRACSGGLTCHHPLMFVPCVMILYTPRPVIGAHRPPSVAAHRHTPQKPCYTSWEPQKGASLAKKEPRHRPVVSSLAARCCRQAIMRLVKGTKPSAPAKACMNCAQPKQAGMG